MSDVPLRGEAGRPKAPSWFAKNEAPRIERDPRFAGLMAEIARAWTEALATLAQATPIEVTFADSGRCRVDEVLALESDAVLASIDANAWGCGAAVAVHRSTLAIIVEALFGGDGGEMPGLADGPMSPITLQLAGVVGRQVAEAICRVLDISADAFAFEMLLAKPDLAFLGKGDTPLVTARFQLAALGQLGSCDVLIPAAAVTTIIAGLAPAETTTAATKSDPGWTSQLESEVGRTLLHLRAKVDVPSLSLGDVAHLRPGQVLKLPPGAANKIILTCADAELFRCDLGQSEGYYTIRLRDSLAGAARSASDLSRATTEP